MLADAAINVLSKLKRQQTRLLADYLQVFLNATETVILSEALLKSTASTLLGLQKMLPPISQEKHAHENQKLSSCFALQLMLQHTLTQPMQQTHEFHRAPDYNADLPNQTQHKHLHNESSLHLKLVQCLVKWLQHWHCGTCKQLMFLLDSLHDPESSSKLLPVDDVPFLDINQLRVGPAFDLMLCSLSTKSTSVWTIVQDAAQASPWFSCLHFALAVSQMLCPLLYL